MALSAPLGEEFRFCNGRSAGSLHSFLNTMRHLSDEEFSLHVNNEKNDFFNWVSNTLKERQLAMRLKRTKTKTGVVIELTRFLKQRSKPKTGGLFRGLLKH